MARPPADRRIAQRGQHSSCRSIVALQPAGEKWNSRLSISRIAACSTRANRGPRRSSSRRAARCARSARNRVSSRGGAVGLLRPRAPMRLRPRSRPAPAEAGRCRGAALPAVPWRALPGWLCALRTTSSDQRTDVVDAAQRQRVISCWPRDRAARAGPGQGSRSGTLNVGRTVTNPLERTLQDGGARTRIVEGRRAARTPDAVSAAAPDSRAPGPANATAASRRSRHVKTSLVR